MNHENNIQKRWGRVKRLLDNGLKIVIATGVLAYFIYQLIAMRREGFSLISVAQLFLLVSTIFLIYRWWKAVEGELQMLEDYLEKFIPIIPASSSLISFSLSFILGLLGYLSNNISRYSAVFAFFKLLEVWGIWVRDSRIKTALEEAKKEMHIDEKRLVGLNSIEHYYFKMPQMPLAATMIFFSCASLILGLFKDTSQLFHLGAYTLMYMVIFINEILYTFWRRTRNVTLLENY